MFKKRFSERGQALIIIVFGMIALISITGVALDGGNAFFDRRQAQTAADTAALTAALTRVRGGDWYNQGLAIAATNGYAQGVVLHSPPIDGPYAGNNEYIQVIITSEVDTFFARVIGVETITNVVDATARSRLPVVEPFYGGDALIGLAPHGCKALFSHGSQGLVVRGSGIFINSDSTSCALTQVGGSGFIAAPFVHVVGGASYSPGSIFGTLSTGVGQKPYPPEYAYQMPNPTCSGAATVVGNVMSPGSWSGSFPPSGVDTLQSGIYCINGAFSVNGGQSLSGTDVLFFQQSGGITWNGGATLNLHAPTSGPYKGLLIYQPMSNTSTLTLNGNSSSSFTGTFLAPSATVRVLGTGGVNGFHSQVIGYNIETGGTSYLQIDYNSSENYNGTTQPVVELTQ